jgi:hypothetical protein
MALKKGAYTGQRSEDIWYKLGGYVEGSKGAGCD